MEENEYVWVGRTISTNNTTEQDEYRAWSVGASNRIAAEAQIMENHKTLNFTFKSWDRLEGWPYNPTLQCIRLPEFEDLEWVVARVRQARNMHPVREIVMPGSGDALLESADNRLKEIMEGIVRIREVHFTHPPARS